MRGLGLKVCWGGSGMSMYRGDSGPIFRVAVEMEKERVNGLVVLAHDVHRHAAAAGRDIVL